jgi:hypothetical protein
MGVLEKKINKCMDMIVSISVGYISNSDFRVYISPSGASSGVLNFVN